MNTITIMSNRRTTANIPEVFYIQDNKISSIRINLPQKIGDYVLNQCSIELRACIDDDYISYEIPTDNKFYDWQPTTDITEKSQLVNLVFYITADGGVIGRTKPIQLNIQVNPDKGEELTPREQFDIVIREQRAEIAEQAGTISEQASQIEQDTETINGLNTQVSELTTENEQLETQHTADQNTIQYLIENPPEVRLQSKSVNPTAQTQTVEPDSGYGGLSSVTVGAVTPPRLQGKAVSPTNLMQNVQPDSGYDGLSNVSVAAVTAQELGFDYADLKEGVEFLGGPGTYNPFPYQSHGGVYVLSVDEDGRMEDVLVEGVDYGKNENQDLQISYLLPNYAKSTLKSLVFKNCKNMGVIAGIRDCGIIEKVTIQGFFKTGNYTLLSCPFLKEVRLESPLQYVGGETANGCANLETIYLANTITSAMYDSFQPGGVVASKLKNVILENGFQLNGLRLQQSTLYSVETIVSCLEALADRTGQTAYTITFGTTNLNKLTAEQKAIATNKNWNLA